MKLQIITLLFINLLFINIRAGYLEINKTFPLSKSYTADASLSLFGGLAQSIRTEGSIVTNPATITSDRFISFKFNFSGMNEVVNFKGPKVNETRFSNNQVGLILPAGIAGVFYSQFYINYDNRFFIIDPSNNQEVDVQGAVNRAVFGWGKNFMGLNIGISGSKNFGSFYTRTMNVNEGESVWQPFMTNDINIYYYDKVLDDMSFGLKKNFGKFDVGASYSLGDKLKFSKIYKQGSFSPTGIIKYTAKDSIIYDTNMGSRLAGGVSFTSKMTGFNIDASVQPTELSRWFEVGVGFRKNLLKNRNLPLKIGGNVKRINLFGDEYYEGTGAIGTEYLMDKQRGKIDFSIGGIHRQGDDGIKENTFFVSIGVTGFSTWGGIELK